MITPRVLERYRAKISRPEGDGCWLWTAALDWDGYGLFWGGERRPNPNGGKSRPVMVRAHRWGYEYLVQPIPEGLQVLHHCDNPPCQRPTHWFLGTGADNMRDKNAKGRGRYTSGEIHQKAKLTAAQVEAIRSRYASQPGAHSNGNQGLTQQMLANEFGVSREAISKVVRGVRHFNHGYISSSQSRGS